ncbi:sigma-70 RNA polymerase sigma factor region 4 domain-containing protein [Massiliimalia timonensis]|uniref:sigma-70 family RNA polymerase sigma factor n=1 Tax=Massiliimalia timonensis TaxID=1987501 RepID=UPI000B8B62A2|nr:sigma-70 family RNA polymerase sigma factor [Massiliimalia timonensis]
MAYNKARAEKEWIKWKETEEKKLRELGVDEETIQRLHTYDWAQFNKERRYLQRKVEWPPIWELMTAQELELPVEDTESFLDSIENMELLQILSKEDKLTVHIVFLKMLGFNGYEIAEKIGISQKAVNLRMVRLRKKLRKFFQV